jgi:hypothetical protein
MVMNNGSWVTTGEELPQRMRQTVRAARSILTDFFSPKESVIANLFPQSMPFTKLYFVDNVIIPLAGRYAQQRGDIAGRKLQLHSTIPSATLLGMPKNKSPTIDTPHPHVHLIWPSQTSTCSVD